MTDKKNKGNTQYKKDPSLRMMRTMAKEAAEATGEERDKLVKRLIQQTKRTEKICGAYIKDKGKICFNKPYYDEEGNTNGRCIAHGGKSTGPQTEEGKKVAKANLHPRAAMVHGLYAASFIMTSEEESFYIEMMNHYIEELDLDPANVMLLDRALRNFIINKRREMAAADEQVAETESYTDNDSKFAKYMQLLGLDRKFNVSKDHKDNQAAQIDIASLLGGADEKDS
jgi:hypothetical protein